MSEAILNPTDTSDAPDGLRADAVRAEAWAGEPFLHADEAPAEVLAPGTARRAALDEALAEIGAGRRAPSARWKIRFGVLAEPEDDDEEDEAAFAGADPGASRRYRFRHPTASGKTIAAAGFVEAARSLGILILTHRRLLVSQFQRDLTTEGYGERFTDAIERGQKPPRENPI